MEDLSEKFGSLRCLIIGDVMVDAYLWGKVDRISPEVPVPVFEVKTRENRLGGAANVALNVKSLGAEPFLVGVVGADVKGEIFQQLLKESAISEQAIVVDHKRPTTSKTRIISGSHHMLRVDEEYHGFISPEVEATVFEQVEKVLTQGVDVAIFEDYDKGLLSPQFIQRLVQVCKQYKVPTCVDPKKNNFSAYKGVSVFKPNFKEFLEGVKLEVQKDDFDQIGRIAKTFLKENNIQSMLITLSEQGMLLVDDKETTRVPAMIRNIADVSGAGDTVISTYALALAAGFSANERLVLANLAGGLVCEEVGVVPVAIEKLQEEFQRKSKG